MANTNGWPPQAYTKETLAEAYEWLKTQPDTVKVLAKDSATLVSLYTNHQLRSQEGITGHFDPSEAVEAIQQSAPVSGEHFKSELKTLAHGLNQFAPSGESPRMQGSNFEFEHSDNQRRNQVESSPGAPAWHPPQQRYSDAHQDMATVQHNPPLHTQTAPQPTLPPHVQRQNLEHLHSMPGQTSSVSASNRAQGARAGGLAALLDAHSQIKVTQIKEGMNLSSDNEALRMLISLGFDRLKNILPVD